MPTTKKVFTSCALGAFIGAFVALQLHHSAWSLLVGITAGFAVGYLSYEFQKVRAAFTAAAKEMAKEMRGWKLEAEWWQAYRKYALSSFGWVTSTCTMVMLIVSVMFQYMADQSWSFGLRTFFWGDVTMITFLTAGALFTGFGESQERLYKFIADHGSLNNPARFFFVECPKVIRKYTCVFFCEIILQLLPVLLKNMLNAIKRFCITFFKLIHSEIRLLCGVDAAIGAAVGYYFESAIFGAVIGGLWGVLNFEIISIRFLKLVPADRSLFFRR